MKDLQRLFYVSRVAAGFSEPQLKLLLAQSRMRNRRGDVTGALAWSGRHFAQVLEGRRDAIETLMASIVADPRHRELKVVFTQPVQQRRYGAWTMGYVEGFGASEQIEALLADPSPDAARAEDFELRLFADPVL
ncbi:BLUF domain-containing protein [Aquabacterium sp. A7-Y]|uniref:BLUF domain-containing protein n=1 Tax=Aquabacterium sp. A7-Y TaxID=1349605 RepID=UPI00223E81C3|nr:BLUF domain-containing protein [Aquabacterium sp. A7-Y]MCW7541549.1 BLUF domain-containing protein [Aquabacterium sp. A7-Y]